MKNVVGAGLHERDGERERVGPVQRNERQIVVVCVVTPVDAPSVFLLADIHQVREDADDNDVRVAAVDDDMILRKRFAVKQVSELDVGFANAWIDVNGVGCIAQPSVVVSVDFLVGGNGAKYAVEHRGARVVSECARGIELCPAADFLGGIFLLGNGGDNALDRLAGDGGARFCCADDLFGERFVDVSFFPREANAIASGRPT